MKLVDFAEALKLSEDHGNRHLLLGNGFSIACRPSIFTYKKIFEQADFSELSSSVRNVFTSLDTQDFEKVIKVIRDASLLLKAYDMVPGTVIETLRTDADKLRELLVQTIATSHPSWPGELSESEYVSCYKFLRNFKSIYTLNYDLLLYWVLMHFEANEPYSPDDGFRKPEDNYDAEYVTWEPWNTYSQNTFYLHGALHIFDTGVEVRKFTWVNTNIRLIEQIRDALHRDFFPLFVAEGSSDEKLDRIRHSDYLARSLKSLTSIGGSLFIYGHSLAANDEHILKRIEKGKISDLFVGIYGSPDLPANVSIIKRAMAMSDSRKHSKPMNLTFFDSSSANVWG